MRAVVCLLPLLALVMGACGGMSESERFSLRTPGVDDPIVREIEGSEKPRTGKPTRDEVNAIRGWADALRAGHIVQAAGFFGVPAIVADGTSASRRLGNRKAILDFNRGLPCGAKLLDYARARASFVIATFELTERPGSGECGNRVGHRSATIFLVERRHILQWISATPPGG
jgi:hypothetical protein